MFGPKTVPFPNRTERSPDCALDIAGYFEGPNDLQIDCS